MEAEVVLLSGDGEDEWGPERQALFRNVEAELKRTDPGAVGYELMLKAVGMPTGLFGEFLLPGGVGAAAVAVVGAYLAGRNGRKVRLKVGDVEAEAGTVEEVERLVRLADERGARASDNAGDAL